MSKAARGDERLLENRAVTINQRQYTMLDPTGEVHPGLTWRRTTRSHPCSICNRPGWCQVSADGAWAQCMRVAGGPNGPGRHKIDSAGFDYWLHRVGDRTVPEASPAGVISPASPERAAPETLDPIYRALLGLLPLTPAHRDNLRRRGLPDDEIDRRGYRSLPLSGRSRLARELVERFGAAVCARVPGLWINERDGQGWWALAGKPGLLIPVRNLSRQIVALKVRADEDWDDGGRYSYVSSRRRGGPGPGAPVHVPLFPRGRQAVARITEGELKADITTALSGTLTLSIPGVSCWRPVLPVVEALGAGTVWLAFDRDWRTNSHVARALDNMARALFDFGFDVKVESW